MSSTSRPSSRREGPSQQRSKGPFRMLAGLGAAVTVVSAVIFHSVVTHDEDSPEPVVVEARSDSAVGTQEDQDVVDLASLVVDGGSISLMSNKQAVTLGTNEGPAWSSIKVPIAIAALENDPSTIDWVQPAIEWSSNEDAEALWYSLGDQMEAGAAVEQLLHSAESDAEVTGEEIHFNEEEAFGAVSWSLSEQVRFANRMWCLPEAEPVVQSMGNITEEQSWGLGRIEGARFKGGWGPDDETGMYTLRQFGLIPVNGGWAPVAISATAEDGTEESGQEILNQMADKINAVRNKLKPTACVPEGADTQNS